MSRDPGLASYTSVPTVLDGVVSAPLPWDTLSQPVNDDLIGAALSLWPQGAAFGSPDGQAVPLESRIARLTRALLSPFETLYQRAYRLALESTVFGADELLTEWEADYGLPDSCVSGETGVAERLRALEAKVNSVAAIAIGDFIRIAAAYGFKIFVREPAIWQCGFSECGGDHELGSPREEIYWIVQVVNSAVDYFRCGDSECGYDPLFSFADGERLLCIMRRIAPAWTIPVLSLDALEPPAELPPGLNWIVLDGTDPPEYLTLDDDYVFDAPPL
ncbi:hypothetical protein BJF92_12235 [Rhizobium rhizosphaerae]|uniref:DUF2313 domain-containing protein n=1 Tax=Xaviernesmea rhizosphaerae TaxID=1672749 RepID=A0A1Q9AN73_9HYPH|nr:putative phage tail protein [Xaviernesmea rhizosphaerae]OLP56833.1 hypothetical protein BJF92_12235 [Xaviernesmea rhizosphaerae]